MKIHVSKVNFKLECTAFTSFYSSFPNLSYTSYADYYGLDAPIAKFDHFHNAGKVKGIYYYPYLPKKTTYGWRHINLIFTNLNAFRIWKFH